MSEEIKLCRFCKKEPALVDHSLCFCCHDDSIRYREEYLAEKAESRYRRDDE